MAIFGLAVALTVAFTIYYIWRAANPLSLLREDIYIDFDGRQQTVTGLYHFKNHLPMNVSVPLRFQVPTGDGLGEAIIDSAAFTTGRNSRNLPYAYEGENLITFEIKIPPFEDGRLSIEYKQVTTPDRLVVNIKSAGAWAPARISGAINLNLPPGYLIARSNPLNWTASDSPEWDFTAPLEPSLPYENIEIKLSKEND
jgi:hypothetical protein